MRWQPSDGVRWMRVDDDLVVFDPTTNGFVELDASGAELWEHLSAAGWADEALVAHLVEVYETPPPEAHAIVNAFVGQLRTNWVIHPAR